MVLVALIDEGFVNTVDLYILNTGAERRAWEKPKPQRSYVPKAEPS